MMPKQEIREQDKQEAIKQLKKLGVKPGVTISCILRHCSRSGMMRHISLRYKEHDITGLAACAMDEKIHDKDGGIKVGGCGMDMGFSLVYNLGHALWPKGTRKPHSTRNGEPDNAGGYALRHTWI